MIRNGHRAHLIVEGVMDGMVGVQGKEIAFVPNRSGARADAVRGGILDGRPIMLAARKDGAGPLWIAQFEVIA